ncbi:cytochrome P450 [Aspergillus keveii]|uniref:Cytochrome P450 n=1 Tax=Aspergillus keveii TaxID=714993 RepID=A0ABR4FKR8_9EURO
MAIFGPRTENEPFYTSSPFEALTGPVNSLEEIDLTDKALYTDGDFHSALRLLRREAPIFWHTKGTAKAFGDKSFWAVTSYEGFHQVIQNGKVFSSIHPVIDRTSEELGLRDLFFTMDGEDHRSYRKPLERYTNVKAINARQSTMDKSIRDDIAAFANSGATDMAPLAYRIQVGLGIAFYDLEGKEAERLRLISEQLIGGSLDPHNVWDYASSSAIADLVMLVEEILADRRQNPKDDIFTSLNMDEDAGRLTHHQILTYLWFSISNVIGTASNAAIYNPMIAMLHHPEQFQLLREHPEHIDSGRAADEALRWGGNSMHLCRLATADTEVLGQPIKKGEVVVAFQASANRDETVFEDPYRFDVTKKRRRFATFGTGMHQCIGMHMMRATATSVLRGLCESFETIEQVGRVLHHIPYSLFNTEVASIPFRGTPASTLEAR